MNWNYFACKNSFLNSKDGLIAAVSLRTFVQYDDDVDTLN